MLGKQRALDMAKTKPAGIGIAAGSPRIRSAHTALLRLAGENDALHAEMSFEEARAVVDAELKLGSKVMIRPELTFDLEGSPEYKEKFLAAYKSGHGLEFVLRESDTLVRQVKDKRSLSYLRIAANHAALLQRELGVSRAFQTIVDRDPEKYAPVDNRIERYFGTHQTIPESFYMRVLEKMQGREAAEQFIERFRGEDGRADGFDFQEGFSVQFSQGPEGEHIVLEGVRGLPDVPLTPELLADIVGDADRLNKEIEEGETT